MLDLSYRVALVAHTSSEKSLAAPYFPDPIRFRNKGYILNSELLHLAF